MSRLTQQALENYKTQVHLQMQRLKAREQELTGKLSDMQGLLARLDAERANSRRVGGLE